MKYVVLASTTHGSGRVMLFASRMNYRNTGGVGITDLFVRNCLGWISQAGDTDRLEVCHVPFETVDGTIPTVDSSFNTSVSRHDVEFLSEDNNLYEFDCIILSGYNNDISPLVRDNLVAYVNSGGGLLVEDFNLSGAVDLFAPISPVTVDDAGFIPVDGNLVWTDSGLAHGVFNASFLGLDIGILNTISEGDVGSGWSILNVFDTEAEKSSEIPIEEQLYLRSADFAIKGTYFVGHYTSVYQDGLVDLET